MTRVNEFFTFHQRPPPPHTQRINDHHDDNSQYCQCFHDFTTATESYLGIIRGGKKSGKKGNIIRPEGSEAAIIPSLVEYLLHGNNH
jgi:hypothetical protein